MEDDFIWKVVILEEVSSVTTVQGVMAGKALEEIEKMEWLTCE